MGRKDVPRNLLDNLPHKRRALAQVTLGPADSGLDNACLGFLSEKEIMLARGVHLQEK